MKTRKTGKQEGRRSSNIASETQIEIIEGKLKMKEGQKQSCQSLLLNKKGRHGQEIVQGGNPF
jgi:hypothetical protein